MKVLSTTLGKFMHDTKLRDALLSTHKEEYFNRLKRHDLTPPKEAQEDDAKYFANAKRLINDGWDGTIYFMRNTALEIIDKISVKQEKKFDYLKKMPDGDYLYCVDQSTFIKTWKEGDILVVLAVVMNLRTSYAQYAMFSFDVESGYGSDERDVVGEFGLKMRDKFLQILIFMHFTELEVVYVKPGRGSGTRSQGKVMNDGKMPVVVVDSTWNKLIIRNEEFNVNGHLALRACGTGRQDRRLTWINPYVKKGYKRGTKKVGYSSSNDSKEEQ